MKKKLFKMSLLLVLLALCNMGISIDCNPRIGFDDFNPVKLFATTGSVKGVVIDYDSKEASPVISGAKITTEPATSETESNSQGEYELKDIKAGEYVLKASKQGYKESTGYIYIKKGETIKKDIYMRK